MDDLAIFDFFLESLVQILDAQHYLDIRTSDKSRKFCK